MWFYNNYKSKVCQNICRDVDCYKRCINIETQFVPYNYYNYNPFYNLYNRAPSPRIYYKYPIVISNNNRKKIRHKSNRRRN